MTVQRPDPVRDTAQVADATARILDAAATMPPGALAEPSLLPGWTRGHVLTHLARNADACVNLLTWARTGIESPMYGEGDARDRAIAAGAGRPAAEQLDDLRAAADRMAAAVAALPPTAWAAQVMMRGGRVIAAAEIPWRRLIEVRLHHVDLGVGHGFHDLPADFAARQLAWVVDGLTGHEGVASVRLRDTSTGARWTIGADGMPEVTVAGPTAGLLAWVTGRGDGKELTVVPERPLPPLPPLG